MSAPHLVPAVPTAFHDDGALDHDAQRELAAAYVAAGANLLIALERGGGEPDTLDADERDAVVRAIREGAGGVPVLVGVGAVGVDAVGRAHRAGAAGAAGVVVSVTDGGSRTADLLAEVASAGLPLWLHHPAGGARRDTAALLTMAVELGSDTVIVEAAPTPDHVADVVAAGQRAYGGLSALFLPEEIEVGAAGTIAGAAVPERLAEVLHDAADGTTVDMEAYLGLLTYLRLELGSPGLAVRKEAWRQRGLLRSGRIRRGEPLRAATKLAVTRRLRAVGVPVPEPYPGA